jgi:hypothetical protein
MSNLNDEMAFRWLRLANYLSDEKLEGKTIFTLSFQDGCNFIIHPENKNGNTLDLSICIPVQPNYFETFFQAKKRVDDSFRNVCTKNVNEFITDIYNDCEINGSVRIKARKLLNNLNEQLDDRVTIEIDGNIYLVKPIITINQLKRIIGADNDMYNIICINRPARWKDNEISEHEFLDLNQPDCKNLKFKCVLK